MAYLESAIDELSANESIIELTVSNFYRSKPHGPQDQPDYINAVARFDTLLDPFELLAVLQQIEQKNGRVRRGGRWGARTLDLDLLLFDNIIIDSDLLTVPHPRMCERPFVLYPLLELSPNMRLPDGLGLADCASEVPDEGIKMIVRGGQNAGENNR